MNIFGDFYDHLPGEGKKRYVKTEKDYEEANNTGPDSEEEVELSQKWVKGRIIWMWLISALVFVFLVSKLWTLQVAGGNYFRELADGNRVRVNNITAPRGIIYDNSGMVLVRNFPSFNLEVYPADLPKNSEEREAIYEEVASLGEVPIEKIKEIIGQDFNTLQPKIIRDNLDRELALILKEKIAAMSGFSVEERATRSYMEGSGLSHILGYVGRISEEEISQKEGYLINDYIGKTGLEAYYEKELKGINGKKQIEVDATGKIVRVLANEEASPGKNLILSIDMGLQKELYSRLLEVAQAKHHKAAAIALKPSTGEILASVSIPDYNNNIFTTYPLEDLEQEFKKLSEDPKQPLFNRVISGVYPPGSTIKPVMAAAGLQEGVISDKTTILAPEKIVVPNKFDPSIIYEFRDWKPGGHGYVDVYKSIAMSCDVFFYAVGGGWDKISGLGIRRIEEFFYSNILRVKQ